MARSKYIYIILCTNGSVVGAFTVKHECISFLEKESTRNSWNYSNLLVARYLDGIENGQTIILTIDQFIKGDIIK